MKSMRRPSNSLAIIVCGFIFLFCSRGQALAADLDPLRESVSEVDRVLERASNGGEWREFLRFADLQAEAAKEEGRDEAVIRDVLARLRAESPYLVRPEFAELRQRLEAAADPQPSPTSLASARLAQPGEDAFLPPDAQKLAAAEK